MRWHAVRESVRCAAVVFAFAVIASRAQADDGGQAISIAWSAPASCPSEDELVIQVEHFLGQQLSERVDQKLRIEARVTAIATGYAADLIVQARTGKYRRHLEHADCASLTEASALVMALAIDPERVQRLEKTPKPSAPAESAPTAEASAPPTHESPAASTPESPAQTAEPAPRAETPSSTPPPATVAPAPGTPDRVRPAEARTPPASAHWVLSAAAIGLAAFGIVPSVGTGLGIELGAERGSFRFNVGVRHWFAATEPVPGFAGASVRVDATDVGVRACVGPSKGRWSLGVCAGPDFGEMRGDGDGVDAPRSRQDTWSAVLAGLTAHYGVGSWALLIAGAEGGMNLERPEFGVVVAGTNKVVYRPPAWSARGFVGVGGQF